MRYLAIVDGEHYPPVVQAALEDLSRSGDVAGALLAGGSEKLPASGVGAFGSIEVRTGDDAREALAKAIHDLRPDEIVDLSDEPVLDYRRRHELIAVALYLGVAYRGPDFYFSPPPRPRLAHKPSIAVIGTGKRTGKTAVAGFAARTLVDAGLKPVVVAMGRGGPAEPEVLRGDEIELTPHDLLELADSGQHAASDYIEDALLARVPTVGCRRCGGGLAGAVDRSNVERGVEIANELPGDLMLLEGSGSAIPPAAADATILIVPATIPAEYLTGYMGPFRLLLSDYVIVTMCEDPMGPSSPGARTTSLLEEAFRGVRGDHEELKIVRTVFRPAPTRSVEGSRAFVATTAPESAEAAMKTHLEKVHGCEVVGFTHSLSNRGRLGEDLDGIDERADVLLCEVKAAGIDVATRRALEAGLDVVYMDNVPCGVDDDDVTGLIEDAARFARERFDAHAGSLPVRSGTSR